VKTVLFIPTASVKQNKPTVWLQQRLDAAINYYQEHTDTNFCFVVAGRWNNVHESYELNEAEVCKRYLEEKLPGIKLLKEDISVETAGGFAFGKPLVASLNPDRVIIFNSKVNEARNYYFGEKIFGPVWQKSFILIEDALSQNARAQQKEPKALHMFQKLFEKIKDGDDKTIRETLLYKTPFYFKNMIDDKLFFDTYWPGGYEDFLDKRLSINNG
jgi:hypothetical protein